MDLLTFVLIFDLDFSFKIQIIVVLKSKNLDRRKFSRAIFKPDAATYDFVLSYFCISASWGSNVNHGRPQLQINSRLSHWEKKEPTIASDGLNKPCFGNLLLVIGKSDFNSRAIN